MFLVHCVEGHPIRGRRTEGYQALRCPECGEGVFVLPRSPLPEPRAPRVRQQRDLPEAQALNEEELVSLRDPGWQPPADAPDEVEIEWTELPRPEEPAPENDNPIPSPVEFDPAMALEADPAESRAGKKPERKGTRPSASNPRAAGETSTDLSPRGTPAAPLVLVPAQDRRFSSWARRNQQPLVFLGVGLVVALTVFWTIQRQVWRDYPRLAELGRTAGIDALNSGQFDRAHRILSEAARAVEALGGEVGGADEILQAAREAAIFVDLAPVPCEDILAQRVRAGDDETWRRLLERDFRGKSLLVEGTLVPGPGGPNGRYDLDYRILIPGPTSPRVARLCLDDLELFQAEAPRPGQIIRLGARLADVEADPASDGWLFRLMPQSGVLMTHTDALEAFGWEPIRPQRPDPQGDRP